jgi:RNA 2',3'-cyclic 3'-phosphodiesterase
MTTRRLFFALLPDQTMRRSLEHSRQRIFPLAGRPVDPANFHMTLAFLGAVGEERSRLLRELAAPMPSCDFTLDRLELWGKQGVLVAAASQVPENLACQVNALWQRLGRLGFARDSRPFKPHVTLARDVRSLRPGTPWTAVHWRCDRVQLMESISVPGGVRYEPMT